MEEEERPEELRIKERPMDKKCIILIIATLIFSLIGYYAIDNRDALFARQVDGEGWDRISNTIVEQNCLSQAKQVAVSEGYSEHFVLSCDCVYVKSDVLKTFDCSVNTIDVTQPARKVLIHCYKINEECAVASDRGMETYSFTELEQAILQ